MELKTAKSHVTLVAALHIGFGALTILAGVIVLFVFNFAEGFIPEEETLVIEILSSIGLVIPTIIAFFGVFEFIAGLTLFSYKKWSRILVIIISAINCIDIPIGTARGVYSIWALMQPEVQDLFD